MDTQRLILFVIFSMSAYFLWGAWQQQHNPVPVTTSARPSTDAPAPTGAVPSPSTSTAASVAAVPGTPAATASDTVGQNLTVSTDLYTADVSTVGGVITQMALNQHRDTENAAKPYVLLQRNPERTFIAQSGLIGDGMPNHRTVWQVLPGPRELAAGEDKLELRLQATATNGDKVVQTLTFHRGSYVIDVAYAITNASSAPIEPYAYFQLTRDTKTPTVQSSMAPASYTGPVLYNGNDKFKKVDFGELDKLAADPNRKLPYTKNADNGWVGMLEHYFVAAWLPSDEGKTSREFYARKLDNGLYADGVILRAPVIAPGQTGTVAVPL